MLSSDFPTFPRTLICVNRRLIFIGVCVICSPFSKFLLCITSHMMLLMCAAGWNIENFALQWRPSGAVNSRAPTTRAMGNICVPSTGRLNFENWHSKRLINLGIESERCHPSSFATVYLATLAPRLREKLYIHTHLKRLPFGTLVLMSLL